MDRLKNTVYVAGLRIAERHVPDPLPKKRTNLVKVPETIERRCMVG